MWKEEATISSFRHIPLSSLWDMRIEIPGKQSEDQEQSGQR